MADLPEELLLQIFSYLQPTLQIPHWSGCSLVNRPKYSTLAAICRVSKTCHRLAVPILYHTVEIYAPAPTSTDFGHKLQVSGCPPNIKPLLRTLLNNAHLAASIKQVKVEGFDLQNEQAHTQANGLSHEPLGQDTQQQCATVVRQLELSDFLEDRLLNTIAVGREEAELAIALAICPFIERLELTLIFSFEESLLMVIVDELMDNIHAKLGSLPSKMPFQRLHEVAIRNETAPDIEHGYFEFKEIFPLVRAPSLLKLQAYSMCCSGDWPPDPHPSLPKHGSQLSKIYIDQGTLSHTTFEVILKAFPLLSKLFWLSSGDDNEASIDFREVSRCLQSYGRNLETLVFMPRTADYHEPLINLSAMPKLKRLAVPWTALHNSRFYNNNVMDDSWVQEQDQWLTTILPKSLQILQIQGDRCPLPGHETAQPFEWSYMDHGGLFPLMKDKMFTSLTSIRLERYPGLMGFLTGQLRAIGREARRDWQYVVLDRLPTGDAGEQEH